jgi:hypothetical protein
MVCSALASRAFLDDNDLELERREGPPSGISTTVVFSYRFKRKSTEDNPRRSDFYALRGIAKEVFAALGGGETFINAERDAFRGRPDSERRDRS